MNYSGASTITIIRNKGNGYLDKGIVPAVTEYVLRELCIKRSASGPESVSIVLLSIRQPATVYNSLCERLSIPSSSVLDAYSEWYSFQEHRDSRLFPAQSKVVSLGDCPSSSKTSTSLADCVLDIFGGEGEKSRILVIDSLALLFSGDDMLNELLTLSDKLSPMSTEGTYEENKLTIVGVLDQAQNHRTVVTYPESLNAICDTNVSVSQATNRHGKSTASDAAQPRDFVRLDIWRRKPSGRVTFELVTGLMEWNQLSLLQIESKLNATIDAVANNTDEQDLAHTLAEHGLSFRVSLTSKEREVRAAAGLPYLHKDEKLADSALQLHPANLQVAPEASTTHPLGYSSDDSSDQSDEEELFSEDV